MRLWLREESWKRHWDRSGAKRRSLKEQDESMATRRILEETLRWDRSGAKRRSLKEQDESMATRRILEETLRWDRSGAERSSLKEQGGEYGYEKNLGRDAGIGVGLREEA
jgi:hypothetical protein